MKKAGMLISVLMGVSMSFFLSLTGTLLSGHFTVPMWLISFGISLVISLMIGFIVPMKPLTDKVCAKFGADEKSIKEKLISAAVGDIVYTPVITVIMCLVMTSIAGAQIGNAMKGVDAELGQTTSAHEELLGEYAEKQEAGADEAELASLREQIGTLEGKREELSAKYAAMQAAKPSFAREIWLSLAVCLAVGFVLCFFLTPMFIRIVMKRM